MGCPTTYEGKTATWSKGRLSRLFKGTLATGTSNYNYSYNALGQRVSKSYSYLAGTSGNNPVQAGQVTAYSKDFFYDHSGRLIAESGSKTYYGTGAENESIVYLYDESSIIGMEYTLNGATSRYYFQRNLQGDVVAIYNANGVLKVKYLYDAWGNCTISSETTDYVVANANPIRYRGYYYDDDTGLYYCNARYYSPKWRRFISPDSTSYLDPDSVNGLNLYCYCYNDPVNYCDPSGHLPNWAKWLIGGIAFAGAVALTLWSGGALTPVLVGMGISIVSGALIEGAIAAYNGDGFWSGFRDGAADGAMWGGIFALASSTVSFVKHFDLIRSRGVVIGKGMDRVGFMADQAALSKYSPMKGYNFIKGSGNVSWRVTLADRLSVAHNKAWINRVMRLNKPIYDIGLGGIREAGAWYGMELVQVADYAWHIIF